MPRETLAELHQLEDAQSYANKVSQELGLQAPIQSIDLPTYLNEVAKTAYGLESSSGAPLAVQLGIQPNQSPQSVVSLLQQAFGSGGDINLINTLNAGRTMGATYPQNLLINLAENVLRGPRGEKTLQPESTRSLLSTAAHELQHRADIAQQLPDQPQQNLSQVLANLQGSLSPQVASIVDQYFKTTTQPEDGRAQHHSTFANFELQNTPRDVLSFLARSGGEIPSSFTQFDPELLKAMAEGARLK